MKFFKNPYPDYPANCASLVDSDGCLIQELQSRIFTSASELEKNLLSAPAYVYDSRNDFTVYTGTGGIAYLKLFRFLKFGERNDLNEARKILQEIRQNARLNKTVSFVLGDPGIYALAGVIYHKLADQKQRDEFLNLLANMKTNISKSKVPDEILYGRSGYLYSLLFVKTLIPDQSIITDDLITFTVNKIIESGKETAKRENSLNPPLKYYWHDSEYIGAAHGYAGILHTLLLAKKYINQLDLSNVVKKSIDFVASLQYPSGNFQSSCGSESDRLVQWCHGAPAVVHLFTLAYKIFGEERYKEVALQCGDITWSRGLLTKGYGLCHGAAGNAYTFLTLYQITNDQRHLYRAVKFAEWINGYGTHGCRPPDTPFSLFEGLAGTIYFLYDILNPSKSAFPAYELLV